MDEETEVALFATCLVDAFRPSVGFAAARLLQAAGCRVVVPGQQTCCGQPGYNAGEQELARDQARRVIALLEPYRHVVVPSGSCAAMMIHHYPRLLADETAWLARAEALAQRCQELSQFLATRTNGHPVDSTAGNAAGPAETVAVHDACSGLRELGLGGPARTLLRQAGHALAELQDGGECCGFGGTFCVKFPEISARMADDKLSDAEACGATTLCSGDLGCLLHLQARARRRGLQLQFRHFAELLAGTPES